MQTYGVDSNFEQILMHITDVTYVRPEFGGFNANCGVGYVI